MCEAVTKVTTFVISWDSGEILLTAPVGQPTSQRKSRTSFRSAWRVAIAFCCAH